MPDVDWVARFREGFRAFRAGRFRRGAALGRAATGRPRDLLVVDPGRAFGTGTHETTRLCLGALEDLAAPPAPGPDARPGLGHRPPRHRRRAPRAPSPVVASDIDPEATALLRATTRASTAPASVSCAPTAAAACGPGSFDLVLANLMALLLVDRSAEIRSLLAPGGALVLSGLLVGRPARSSARPSTPPAARPPSGCDGEWAALVYEGVRVSSSPRFHVPGAAPGGAPRLPEHAAHHAREVLRLRAGRPCAFSTATGAEFEAALDEVSRRTVSARLGAARRAPRPSRPCALVLAVSPLKGDRMELVVQKATELGVAGDLARGHVPHGRRGPPRPPGLARRALGARRLRRRRAVRPRGRARSRADHDPRRAASRGPSTAQGSPFSRPRATPPLAARVDAVAGACCCSSARPAASSPPRPSALVAAGFPAASLGPRILRAETAAVAAVAIAQAAVGRPASLGPCRGPPTVPVMRGSRRPHPLRDACSAVIAATSAKSWTEQPRETSLTGLFSPWKMGPIALAPPSRSVIL